MVAHFAAVRMRLFPALFFQYLRQHIHTNLRVLNQLLPHSQIAHDHVVKSLRGGGGDFEAVLFEAGKFVGLRQPLDHDGVELVDDGFGRARGCGDAPPAGVVIAGHRFRDGRDVRESLEPRGMPDAENPDAAGLVQRQQLQQSGDYHLHIAGDEVIDRQRAAFVGHMHDLDAGQCHQLRGTDVIGRADTR